MKKIQVLGTGCPKCKQTTEHAEQAVAETGVDAQIEKVTALSEIMAMGVMITPALAVDGEVKVSGKIPSVEEIKQWLV